MGVRAIKSRSTGARILGAGALLAALAVAACSPPAEPAPSAPPARLAAPAEWDPPPLELRRLLAEARSLGALAGDDVVPGYAAAPWGVMVVGDKIETLFCHDGPAAGFSSLGRDPATGCEMLARPRLNPPHLQATFPAVDARPTVVIGPPAASGENGQGWVLTVLHEHFHQLQMSAPDYYPRADALGLAGDDASGMWMLNYPFPYDEPAVAAAVDAQAAALLAALAADDAGLRAAAEAYRAARNATRDAAGEQNWRYFEFQAWQEGAARWSEGAAVQAAAARPEAEAHFDLALAAEKAHGRTVSELEAIRAEGLSAWGRVALYALGAGEATLLDRLNPEWRADYLAAALAMGPLLDAALNPEPSPAASSD